MEFQNINRIAIFKFRNIGDILLMTPMLRALRERFPQAHITVVVNSGTDGVLKNNPDIDELLVYQRENKAASWLERLVATVKFLGKLRAGRFDLTLSLTEGDRSAWYSLACFARVRLGWMAYHWRWWYPCYWAYTRRNEIVDWHTQHQATRDYYLLAQAGLSLPLYPLRLVVSEEDRHWAQEKLSALRPSEVVHVHPVSRWLWKCWDDAAMAEVIDWLERERGFRVVVTTGPSPKERERAQAIVARCQTKPLFLDGTITLPQLAALIAQAQLFLGVDTAPMHMAAAVGTPVVALFGPTHITSWSPWRVAHKILATPCLCHQGPKLEICQGASTRACLAKISVASVQAALDELQKESNK